MTIRPVNFSGKVINIERSVLIEPHFSGSARVDSALSPNRDRTGDGVWHLQVHSGQHQI